MVDSGPVQRIPIASWLCAWAALVLGISCAAAESSPPPEPGVILLSFDGTRPADVLDAGLPGFDELARRGLAAERLVPVFPTNTFPNHVTLATGVWPDVHGIVNNAFVDPERGLFRYGGDPSWILVEPIWSWLARHGVVSASYHWVGSEGPWRSGLGPLHWRRFDAATPAAKKLEQILAWLDEPDPALRPRFVTAWLRGADHAGHEHGPGSEAARRALRSQDAALSALLRGLEGRGLLASTTLLVVSDHGMAPVTRRVDLQAALDAEGLRVRVLGGGGFATLRAEGDAERERPQGAPSDKRPQGAPSDKRPKGAPSELERALAVARALGLEAWPRAAAPPELRVDQPRFGDAVVLAPPGTAIADASSERPPLVGSHGYRPELASMGGLFLALGRGAPPGARIGPVQAVDVAPTLLALLGVPQPDWMPGRAVAALRPGDALP